MQRHSLEGIFLVPSEGLDKKNKKESTSDSDNKSKDDGRQSEVCVEKEAKSIQERRMLTNLRYSRSLCLTLLSLCFAVWQQRGICWLTDLIRQIIFSQHLPCGRDQAGIVVGVVLRRRGPGAQQRKVVPGRPGQEERWSSLALPVLQGVWKLFAFAFR